MFLEMGFAPAVLACSAEPQTDGYHGTLNGLPYHIHPAATPDAWAALQDAITESAVTLTEWEEPVADPQAAIDARRAERTRLLYACDWTQVTDSLIDKPVLKAEWATYRQQLRDLDMSGTGWPEPPASA